MLCLHDTIHDDDPAVQRLLSAVEDAHSLTALILAAWQVARVLTIHLVEAVLAERSQHPTRWPRCPQCGAGLRSKGFAKRQITSLFGPIQWRRRVGRCLGCRTFLSCISKGFGGFCSRLLRLRTGKRSSAFRLHGFADIF